MTNTYTTAPFDLQLAISGHPCVTRDGRDADYLRLSWNNQLPVFQIGEYETEFYENGRFTQHKETKYDLFLKLPIPNPQEQGEKRLTKEQILKNAPDGLDGMLSAMEQYKEQESRIDAIEFYSWFIARWAINDESIQDLSAQDLYTLFKSKP